MQGSGKWLMWFLNKAEVDEFFNAYAKDFPDLKLEGSGLPTGTSESALLLTPGYKVEEGPKWLEEMQAAGCVCIFEKPSLGIQFWEDPPASIQICLTEAGIESMERKQGTRSALNSCFCAHVHASIHTHGNKISNKSVDTARAASAIGKDCFLWSATSLTRWFDTRMLNEG